MTEEVVGQFYTFLKVVSSIYPIKAFLIGLRWSVKSSIKKP